MVSKTWKFVIIVYWCAITTDALQPGLLYASTTVYSLMVNLIYGIPIMY